MNRLLVILVSMLIAIVASPSRAEDPTSIGNQGWNITADPGRGVLNIEQESLGLVLKDVRLNLQNEHELLPLNEWSVEAAGKSVVTLHTRHPAGSWTFAIRQNSVNISSTFTTAILTAQAPAPQNRIPVRTLDPQGSPVDWRGTDEAMLAYGGTETRNQSFLPRKNPEVMYLALGLVSGSQFHGLFDRKLDVVIQFTDQTTLRRADDDETLLDVKMPVPGNAMIRLIPDYYTQVLGMPSYTPFDDTYFKAAPIVWSSWTGYYQDVTENDIVRNTDWLAKNLKSYGFQFVQLDDGYDRGKNNEHSWIENWDRLKFPHGPQWLTSYIKSKGLHAGLWLVPNAYAGAVDKHPDWYLYSTEGQIVHDYETPALDSTNPQALGFLKTLFSTLDDWGFEYYKFDGEGSLPQTMTELDRDRLFDRSVDPVASYHNRLKVIRETVGPHTFLEGCPAGMPLNGIGYFDSYFNGHDVFNNWSGMHALFSSISANTFFNHIVAYVMPGEGLELGTPMTMEVAKQKRAPGVLKEISQRESPASGVGVTDAEARTLVSYVSLTGVAYPVGNVMPDLPEQRLKLLRQTMPTMPILPLDLFSRGTDLRDTTFRRVHPDDYIHNYPEVLDLKVQAPSGAYDVVALTNWRSEAATRTISLIDKLGLESDSGYIAFDFWNQKLLGVFTDRLQIDIEPHDTRVLSIHPLLKRPQLIGNARHITGAYSILDQRWEAANKKLSGTSESLPEEIYTLWFHVPRGLTLSQVNLVSKTGRKIPAQHVLTGESLMVSFPGQLEPVSWELSFAGGV